MYTYRIDAIHGSFIGGFDRILFIERETKAECLRIIAKLKKLRHFKLVNCYQIDATGERVGELLAGKT